MPQALQAAVKYSNAKLPNLYRLKESTMFNGWWRARCFKENPLDDLSWRQNHCCCARFMQ